MLVKNIIIVNYELVCFRYCHSVSGYLDEVFVWLTADCSCCCSCICSSCWCCRWSCRWSCSVLNMNYAALRKLDVDITEACAWASFTVLENKNIFDLTRNFLAFV